ncbi:MAG: LysM peptidoglycan-binding domain-containing protein [Myxococcales bacterium]
MRTKTIARWRRAALAGTLAASLAVPATARAQQDKPAETPPAADQQAPAADQQAAPAQPEAQPAQPAAQPKQKPENAPVITEQSPRPPPDTDIKPVPGAPEEYTIIKGDTLWDLSQKFLNNPWYWPKIWSLNPGIENPHWIYPGNKLRIVPGEGGAQAPAQVQAQPPAEEQQPGVDAEAANAPPEEAPAAEEASTSVTPPASPDLEVMRSNSREASNNSVSVSGKLAFTPPPVVTVRSSGLVTPEERANAGTLDASFEEKELLATYDTAYVNFKGGSPVKPGDKLVIFRPVGDVIDPISHQKLADQTKTVGVSKVLAVDGDRVTVQIERTFEEIGRGDLVKPWVAQEKRVAPKPNTADVQGVIVQAVNPGLSTFGESNEVFIDRGTADGVQEGNTFAVVRHGDGLSNVMVTKSYAEGAGGKLASSVKTPDENVGLLLVVDAKEHLSTAVVVKSVRELQSGDVVEMHTAGAGGGSP